MRINLTVIVESIDVIKVVNHLDLQNLTKLFDCFLNFGFLNFIFIPFINFQKI